MDKLLFGNNYQVVFLADPATGLPVTPSNATPPPPASNDGLPAATMPMSGGGLFNGTTYDRTRSNLDVALLTYASASVGSNSADQLNVNAKGIQLGLNITAASGTGPTITVFIEGKDFASGAYYTLFTSSALSATAGFTLISMYPSLTPAANVAAQVLPRIWRARAVFGGVTPAITATIGASVIL